MVTSYGGETSGRMSCSCLDTNTTLKCTTCKATNCHNNLGIVCQTWEHLQPVNIRSERTAQPPVIEPTSTTATARTDSTITGTKLITSTTQPTPDNNTITLFGAIIGVLFALLL